MKRIPLLTAMLMIALLAGCAQKVRFAPYAESADGLTVVRTETLRDASAASGDHSMRVDAPMRIEIDGNARRVTLGIERTRCVIGRGESAEAVDSDDAADRTRGLAAGPWIPLAHESFRMRFDTLGQVTDVRAYPVVKRALAAYAAESPQARDLDAAGRRIARMLHLALFEEPLSYLPDGPVVVGDRWRRMVTFRSTLRLCDLEIRGVRVVRCKLVRVDESDGRVAVIEIEGVSRTQSRNRSAEPAWRTRGALHYDLESQRPRRLELTMSAAVGRASDNLRTVTTTLEVSGRSR